MKMKFLIMVVLLVASVCVSQSFAQKSETGARAFNSFLVKLDAAQVELQNGRAAAFKAIWSQGDDITLSGGFGGTVEKGWTNVSKRLDWVAANFSNGTNNIERIVSNRDHNLGYVVQLEHISFIAPQTGKPATRDYRVTMIFRLEKAGWKLIHRQADSLMVKQAPK